MEDRYQLTEVQCIKLDREYIDQSILDIGGGGEGFIGRIYGKNVIALDRRKEELLETKNNAIKLVMDASDLSFTDDNFDVVTLFYSLMYMSKDIQKQVISEAYRVLKKGGIIDIWDIEVPKYDGKGKDIFVAQLSVSCLGETTTTGYGVPLNEVGHSKSSLIRILEENNFIPLKEEERSLSYRLQYMK